jgi:alkanesulfonate monooxygenase SsuD/methylene tetrahydromethanopterin reductase-like flavin-dependent oxidoreductase (luciferase family)
MVGNHVADLVARYGADGSAVPRSLTDYIAGRQGYDYSEHGRAGNTHTEFVPDEIVERFCIIGPPETQIARLTELAGLGVGHFGLYLQHDAEDATLASFGTDVIPAVSERLTPAG